MATSPGRSAISGVDSETRRIGRSVVNTVERPTNNSICWRTEAMTPAGTLLTAGLRSGRRDHDDEQRGRQAEST